MTKRLYTKSKIFFPDPYVVMVEYKDVTAEAAETLHRKAMRLASKCIHGTWGYTRTYDEVVQLAPETPAKGSISYLFGTNVAIIPRAYACFKDEIDALQFRLSLGVPAHRVSMWPTHLTFTIFEYADSETE